MPMSASALLRLAAAAASLVTACPAVAQTRAPLENGGIVNGEHREPNPAVVIPEERRDGVAPSAGQADQNAGTVEQLNKELLGTEQASPPSQSSVPPIQDGRASGTR